MKTEENIELLFLKMQKSRKLSKLVKGGTKWVTILVIFIACYNVHFFFMDFKKIFVLGFAAIVGWVFLSYLVEIFKNHTIHHIRQKIHQLQSLKKEDVDSLSLRNR